MTAKRVPCPKQLNEDTGRGLLEAVRDQTVSRGDTIVLDLAGTEVMDSRGGAWLVQVAELVRSRQGEFRCEGQRGRVAEFLDMIEPGLVPVRTGLRRGAGFLERVGEVGYQIRGELREFRTLLIDTIYWTLLAPFEGRGFRWGLWVEEVYEMGVRALWITCVMNFLLGLIIAMLSAAQLRQFALEIYVADLIVIAFARELAAIMTAVVISARTGAAIAAELATMKVQEEIDALRGMGLNVAQFLVAPKVLALVLVMPCLVGLGMIAGVAGGAVWGIYALNVDADAWLRETLAAAYLGDVFQGLMKSLFFAVVIVLIGCHNGLRVTGGSRGVGLVTTRAVVMDSFFVVVIDMIFALIFYYVL
jgi:phospholipid/cholesterol/gamma-HCH transport system permease protein